MLKSGTDRTILKKWIVLLLSASCLVLIVLHISEEPPPAHILRNSSQVDSLITITIKDAGIPDSRVSSRLVEIDSVLIRKVYTMELPTGIPATKWHYELQKRVGPYGIETPSKVTFPEMHMNIHMTYGSNVIRTLNLRTGTDDQDFNAE